MKLLRRLARAWRADREDRALQEELEYHRARVQADLEAGGTPRADAAAASRRAMGNLTLLEDDARDVWIVRSIDYLRREARLALRGLWREPTFALTATLTLALGLTTITTVFSVADSELWKPLPYPHPDRLMAVYSRAQDPRAQVDPLSLADLQAWRDGAPAFEAVAGDGRTSRRVLHLDTAQSIVVSEVTANYFDTLGCSAIAGRLFTRDDAHHPGAVVMTDRVYRRLFDADPSSLDALPTSFTLDDDPVTIVGIIKDDGLFCGDTDAFVAINEDGSAAGGTTASFFGAIARLRPGVDPQVAQAQLQAASEHRGWGSTGDRAGHLIHVEDARAYFFGHNWRPMFFFLGAALVVLLLSAVNVASLLLARAVRRTREFALRGALGGGLGSLVRQLMVEGLVLALPAGALGLTLAFWAVRLFVSALPADALMYGDVVPINQRVAAFALIVTTLTTLLFVTMPIVTARRLNLAQALGVSSRTGRSAREGRTRAALLAAQLGLTLVLLAGAGLFLKSFVGLTRVPLGFDASRTVALRLSLSGPRYESADQLRAFADAVVERGRTTPGVDRAGVGSSAPLDSGPLVLFAVPGRDRPAAGREPRAIIRAVTPDFFAALGIRILRGRAFVDADRPGAPRVAIVNRSLVAQCFGSDVDPVGRAIELLPGARAPWTRQPGELQIVGVVDDVKEVGLNEIDFADIYVPFAQVPSPSVELVARAVVPPASIGETLRRRVAAVDPNIPVTSVSTFADRRNEALKGDRFNTLLVGVFAAMAVFLAIVGVYGAVAYALQARVREFGVRMALGATPARLVGASLWQAARLGLVGGGAGLAIALLLARLLGDALYLVPGDHNGLLYGVKTTDPWMLGGAFAALVLLAVLAGALPARRAAAIDPTVALRSE